MMAQAIARILPAAKMMNVDKPMETGKEVAPGGPLRLPFFSAIPFYVAGLARFERIRDFPQAT